MARATQLYLQSPWVKGAGGGGTIVATFADSLPLCHPTLKNKTLPLSLFPGCPSKELGLHSGFFFFSSLWFKLIFRSSLIKMNFTPELLTQLTNTWFLLMPRLPGFVVPLPQSTIIVNYLLYLVFLHLPIVSGLC